MWFGLKGWDILAVVLLCERTVLTGLYLHNPKEITTFLTLTYTQQLEDHDCGSGRLSLPS